MSIDPAVLRSLRATSIGSFGSTLTGAVSFGLILNPLLGAYLFIVGGFKLRAVDF